MYITRFLKVLTLSFILSLNLNPSYFILSKPNSNQQSDGFEGFVHRLKKAINTFTDCSVDTLLKNCNRETSKNFECFRTIGECISSSARQLIIPEEDTKQEDEL